MVVAEGCSLSGESPSSRLPAPIPSGEKINEQQEAISNATAIRHIPLRFVLMTQTGTEDVAPFSRLRTAVMRANFAFHPAGVQFYIRSVEEYTLPAFYNARADINAYSWGTSLWNDLKQIFPSMMSNAYQGRSASKFQYLRQAAIDYGKSDEILIYVAQVNTSAYGHYPWFGRSIYTSTSNLPNATSDYNGTWNFVHELGHFFGLSHTFPGNFLDGDLYLLSNKSVGPRDPATSTPAKLADYWDLVYRPLGPGSNEYYTSDVAAAPHEAQLLAKNLIGPENCSSSNCTISCSINGATVTTDDPGGVGLGLTFPGGVRGWNAMGYLNPACPQGLSDSQIRQIRNVLRYDMPIEGAWTPNRTGLRPSLGLLASSPQIQTIDIDGDGRRDFGVWEPPAIVGGTGFFRFRKSTTGTLTPSYPFGVMGDVPALADYDNDGKTDIAVFRTGGVNGIDPTDTSAWFIWCPSSHASGGDGLASNLDRRTSPPSSPDAKRSLPPPHRWGGGQGVRSLFCRG